MTIELACLVIIAVFAALMWVPFIVGVTNLPEDSTVDAQDFSRPVDLSRLPN